jgi:hypothetical protein
MDMYPSPQAGEKRDHLVGKRARLFKRREMATARHSGPALDIRVGTRSVNGVIAAL